jgi:Rrf2 family transcriptional regulator, cysteine metabolism repressor
VCFIKSLDMGRDLWFNGDIIILPMELSRFFRISSRSHHGLVFLEHVSRADGQPTSVGSIARRTHLPEKYLEELARTLRDKGILTSVRGRSGGYVLARDPEAISVQDIVHVLDGPVVLAACQDESVGPCPSEKHCATKGVFGRLQQTIERELSSTSIADLLHEQQPV